MRGLLRHFSLDSLRCLGCTLHTLVPVADESRPAVTGCLQHISGHWSGRWDISLLVSRELVASRDVEAHLLGSYVSQAASCLSFPAPFFIHSWVVTEDWDSYSIVRNLQSSPMIFRSSSNLELAHACTFGAETL